MLDDEDEKTQIWFPPPGQTPGAQQPAAATPPPPPPAPRAAPNAANEAVDFDLSGTGAAPAKPASPAPAPPVASKSGTSVWLAAGAVVLVVLGVALAGLFLLR